MQFIFPIGDLKSPHGVRVGEQEILYHQKNFMPEVEVNHNDGKHQPHFV